VPVVENLIFLGKKGLENLNNMMTSFMHFQAKMSHDARLKGTT
jgi:hypothetical protein